MTVGQELGDGVGLLDGALGGLENGELVGGVEGLVGGSLSLFIGVNNEVDGLASKLGNDAAAVDEGVSGELGVDFLKEECRVRNMIERDRVQEVRNKHITNQQVRAIPAKGLPATYAIKRNISSFFAHQKLRSFVVFV